MPKILALLYLFLCSCKTQSSDDGLILNRVTNDSSRFQWIDLSREDFLKYADRQEEDLDKAPLAANHPLALRMQYWLDSIDRNLRQKYSEHLKNTPKPQALLFNSPDPIAYTTGATACLELKVQYLKAESKSSNSAGSDASALHFDRQNNAFSPREFSGKLPPSHEMSLEQRIEFLRWMLAPYPSCQVDISGDTVMLSGRCGQGESMPLAATTYSKICTSQVSSSVVVHTGLIAKYEEAEVIAALAHELGQYYMAHMVTPAEVYNYTYRLGTKSPTVKPQREPSLEGLKKQLDQLAADRWRPWRKLYPVPNQKLDSILFLPMASLSTIFQKSSCEQKIPCEHACSRLAVHYNELSQAVGTFPFEPLIEAALPAYNKYERLSQECLDSVKDSEFFLPQIADSMGSLIGRGAFHQFFTVKPAYPSAWEAWQQVGSELPLKVQQLDSSNSKLFKLAADEGLGFFTSEGEADSLALEWLDSMGISSENFVRLQVKGFLSLEPTIGAKPDISAAECERLYKNNWLDSSGRTIFVPLDAPGQGSRGSCYRAFNAAREIAVHSYNNDQNTGLPPAPGPEWKSLVEMALSIDK